MVFKVLCLALMAASAFGTDYGGTATDTYDGGYSGVPKGYDPSSKDSMAPNKVPVPAWSCATAAQFWFNTTVAKSSYTTASGSGCTNFRIDTASPTPAPRFYDPRYYNYQTGETQSTEYSGYDANAVRPGQYDPLSNTYDPTAPGSYNPSGSGTYNANSIPDNTVGTYDGQAGHSYGTAYSGTSYTPAQGGGAAAYDPHTGTAYDPLANSGYDPNNFDKNAVRNGQYDSNTGAYNPDADGKYDPSSNTYTPNEYKPDSVPENDYAGGANYDGGYGGGYSGGRRLRAGFNAVRRLKTNLYILAEDHCVWAYENLVHPKVYNTAYTQETCENDPVARAAYLEAVQRNQVLSLSAQNKAWSGLAAGLAALALVAIIIGGVICIGGMVAGARAMGLMRK